MRRPKSIYFFLIAICTTFIFSCKEKIQKEESSPTVEIKSEVDTKAMTKLADSIAMHAQVTLLSNVANAIQKGGTAYAVDFCNTKAISLTDSIANLYMVDIQRVTNKPRNPENRLATTQDSLVWNKMLQYVQNEGQLPSGIVEKDGADYIYYKPIAMGMPTCVKCHGGSKDINPRTKEIIQQRYPKDMATGYKTGDFRGMWKIKMENL